MVVASAMFVLSTSRSSSIRKLSQLIEYCSAEIWDVVMASLIPIGAPYVSPTSLPQANVTTRYWANVVVSGGLPPYNVSIRGTLPRWMQWSVDGFNVTLYGMPKLRDTQTTATFTLVVSVSSWCCARATLQLGLRSSNVCGPATPYVVTGYVVVCNYDLSAALAAAAACRIPRSVHTEVMSATSASV